MSTAGRRAWHVASLSDGDTHWACYDAATRTCTAICGRTFPPVPIALDASRLHLDGWPPDPGQVCAQCAAAAMQDS